MKSGLQGFERCKACYKLLSKLGCHLLYCSQQSPIIRTDLCPVFIEIAKSVVQSRNYVFEKERKEWIVWINDSIAFYDNKINELDEILKDKDLSSEERQTIETEKTSAIDDKKKWEQAQNELKT